MHRAVCVRRPAAHRTNPSESPITPQAEGHSSSGERRPTATSTILVSRLLLHESAQVNQDAAEGEQRAQSEVCAVVARSETDDPAVAAGLGLVLDPAPVQVASYRTP